MADNIQLIVGLGNPGPEYQYTRHNAGIWLIETLATHYQTHLQLETKLKGRCARISIDNHDVWLFTPTTYMNHSGQAVKAITNFYKIPPQNILVAHDELDFAPGTIRLKQSGSHGGHNGLRDIIQQLNSNDFYRLRIGIGHPGHRDQVHDYVLNRPSKSDFTLIIENFSQVLAVLPDMVTGAMHKAMQTLHTE